MVTRTASNMQQLNPWHMERLLMTSKSIYMWNGCWCNSWKLWARRNWGPKNNNFHIWLASFSAIPYKWPNQKVFLCNIVSKQLKNQLLSCFPFWRAVETKSFRCSVFQDLYVLEVQCDFQCPLQASKNQLFYKYLAFPFLMLLTFSINGLNFRCKVLINVHKGFHRSFEVDRIHCASSDVWR